MLTTGTALMIPVLPLAGLSAVFARDSAPMSAWAAPFTRTLWS
ncbi:hypothetical protein [Micromonospora sp. WMMD964]|nr:hypothetical protein [Micromonospora sp. WMMD964]WFF03620.1 hypothetical protein O7616_13070 [Micromonospora sp. WMMD964]